MATPATVIGKVVQVAGPAVAAFAINAFHSYTLLFVLGALLASLSALLVQRIKSVQ